LLFIAISVARQWLVDEATRVESQMRARRPDRADRGVDRIANQSRPAVAIGDGVVAYFQCGSKRLAGRRVHHLQSDHW
jgi:hypothetical protein